MYISKMNTNHNWPDALQWLANTYGRAGDRWDFIEPVMVEYPSFSFKNEIDKIFFDLLWL